MQTGETPALAVSYFDGVSARAHEVMLRLEGGNLLLAGVGVERMVALRDVQWPERTRHGKRVAHFRSGGSVQCADAAAWDNWSRASGQRESLVVSAQQSWRWVLACVLGLVVLAVVLQQWGVPAASRAVVAALPLSVDQMLGEKTLALIDERLMQPSKLSLDERARLQAALVKALGASPAGSIPHWQLLFRKSRIGPNAFALPGGTLVMTDELVELVEHDDQVITAVLAHEIGHVQHRHGLRMLVQATALSGLAGIVLGDFSTVLASVPVLLGQASYSREAEHEADAAAVRILKAASISPLVMITLFEKLDKKRNEEAGETSRNSGEYSKGKRGANPDAATPESEADAGSWLGIAFASHPSDADRISYFRDAARP
jgi:Zn-dependent protease with chaperone function